MLASAPDCFVSYSAPGDRVRTAVVSGGGLRIHEAVIGFSARMENPRLTVRSSEPVLHYECLERIEFMQKSRDSTMLSHGLCDFQEFISLVWGDCRPYDSLTLDGACAVLVVSKKVGGGELVFALHFVESGAELRK